MNNNTTNNKKYNNTNNNTQNLISWNYYLLQSTLYGEHIILLSLTCTEPIIFI